MAVRTNGPVVCLAWLAATVLMSTGIAAAQNTVYKTQMAGNVAGCGGTIFTPDGGSSLTVVPTLDNKGKNVYYVQWGWWKWHGTGWDATWAYGIAPQSAVTQTSNEKISLDVDLPQLLAPYSWANYGYDENGNWYWNGNPPSSFPLRGTCTAYQGPGGSANTASGAAQYVRFDWGYTYTANTSGNFTQETADYVGVIGPITVEAGTYYSPYNAGMFVNRGNTTYEVTRTK